MTPPTITTKQQEILTLIPQFRFLNRLHIQHLLKHKDKKRINNWLKDLTEKKYLKRIYDNTIIGKNRVPAIYSLDNNGVRFLKEKGIYDKNFIHQARRSESQRNIINNIAKALKVKIQLLL